MSFFRLNVNDINETVSNFNSISKKLIENKDLACESLIKIDFSWEDLLTAGFISKVKENDYKLDDYIFYLKRMYREILNFCDDIEKVCSRFEYKNLKNISFNDNREEDCIRYLNQAIELLNINLQKLKSVKNSIDYLSVSSINKKIEEINKIKKMIVLLKEDILNFCDSINDCLDNSKRRKNNIEKVKLDISLMELKSIYKNG